ncbi:hypothetical protein, partial [Paenibacillus chondroitinus]
MLSLSDSFVAQLFESNALPAWLELLLVEELSALLVFVVALSPVVAVESVSEEFVEVLLVVDELSPVVEVLGPALEEASVSDEFVASLPLVEELSPVVEELGPVELVASVSDVL